MPDEAASGIVPEDPIAAEPRIDLNTLKTDPNSPRTDPNTPEEKAIDIGDGITMEFVLIPAGEFDMGSPLTEGGRDNDEGPSNSFGLYDMHGNVWEWCSDYYAADYYQKSMTVNPIGSLYGKSRVYRDRSWYQSAEYCRSANRSDLESY